MMAANTKPKGALDRLTVEERKEVVQTLREISAKLGEIVETIERKERAKAW